MKLQKRYCHYLEGILRKIFDKHETASVKARTRMNESIVRGRGVRRRIYDLCALHKAAKIERKRREEETE